MQHLSPTAFSNNTAIPAMLDFLIDHAPEGISIHSAGDNTAALTLVEIGYPFSVKLTVHPSGAVTDEADDISMTYRDVTDWMHQMGEG